MYPSSRNPCRNASVRIEEADWESGTRKPILGTFFCCCACATAPVTTIAKAITESPSHFRFLIFDFRLSDRQLQDSVEIPSCIFLPNLKSKIHLITLSARNRTDCGIVTQFCFAFFTLITTSDLLGWSTGRSAGSP